MPRRAILRERVEQPQGPVGAADVFGMRVTFLHTPSMGAIETGSGLRRNGVLGAGASIESMSGGEAAYRFTGGQTSGACSFGVARATRTSGSFVTLVRFRLNALGGNPFCCWGTGGNFLTQIDAAGNITTACGDAVNQSVYARATSGLGLQVGVAYTVALGYLSGNPPTFTGAINGRPLAFPTSVVGFGDASILRDSGARNTQIGIADDGGPMNGFVSIAGVLIGRHTQAMLNAISANPWMLAEATSRSMNASAVTIYRLISDVATNGWTAVGAASVAAATNEASPSDAEWGVSPNLTSSYTGAIPPKPAGTYTVRFRGDRTLTQGQMRIRYLDAGGVDVGGTAWQALTGAATTYTLSATITATATQARVEVQP